MAHENQPMACHGAVDTSTYLVAPCRAHDVCTLPLPHPLDFDWRFTEQSRVLLLQEIMCTAAAKSDRVILIGTPTLYLDALSSGLADRCFLFDACSETISALTPAGAAGHARRTDVTQEDLPVLTGRIVVADPPWYAAETKCFLWAASRMLEIGGVVLLSAPPAGTRPTIEAEWLDIVAFANDLGLILRSTNRCLRYDSPFFERNAFYAAGETAIDFSWRSGILARFDKIRSNSVPRPMVHKPSAVWVEHIVGGVRFRLRRSSRIHKMNPVLRSLVEGDVLPSVSRRDPRRVNADVWTSGNRIFSCADTAALGLILEARALRHRASEYLERSSGLPLSATENEVVNEADAQISVIIAKEAEEVILRGEGRIENLAARMRKASPGHYQEPRFAPALDRAS